MKLSLTLGFRLLGVARPLLFIVAVIGMSDPALASSSYFSYLQSTYGFSGDCSLCHDGTVGSAGTVNVRPFGLKMTREKGLVGNNFTTDNSRLVAALDKLTDADDSDGDGAPDLLEIEQNGNPNDPSVLPGGFVPPEPVEYGCVGGTISRSTDSSPTSALVASGFVAAILLWSRRRRGA